MTTKRLYNTLEFLFRNENFNLNGVWDKTNYSAKMLLCERLVESERWRKLPDNVLDHLIECELDFAVN